MIASLAACDSGSTQSGSTEGNTSKETTAKATGDQTADATPASSTDELSVCLASEPDTIDPALNSAVDGATLLAHLFSGLAKWEQDGDKFVIVYPEYYSTWNQPDERIAFAEKFLWAKDNDQQLYNDLSKLVVRSNYAYVMNPNRLSSFFSANLSVTKELGDHLSVSFYANNFFNSMRRVRSTQTNLETSLFESGYIPSYYYGLSLRLKI